MVFVFGIDVPLVELIFVLTLILAVLFGILVYMLVNQIKLHSLLEMVLRKEDIELKGLKEINSEEKKELNVLRSVKKELDKLLYSEQHFHKLMAMTQPKQGKLSPADKKKIAADFWKGLLKLSKGHKKKEIVEILIQRQELLKKEIFEINRERQKIDEFIREMTK